jgi:hypothetical protein
MQLDDIARTIPARPGRVVLTFEEVIASRRPAVFAEFGDFLLYLDGRVFILEDADLLAGAGAALPVLDQSLLVHAVGIECGWRHDEGCACRFCSANAEARAT